MVLGISIPEGAKVVSENGFAYIIFDEKKTKRDLWKICLTMWLTQGDSKEDFLDKVTEDNKALYVSHRNKIRIGTF